MALTPAEKQRRYRKRQSALARSRPDLIEHALLQDAARAERGELSIEERVAVADKVADLANRYCGAPRRSRRRRGSYALRAVGGRRRERSEQEVLARAAGDRSYDAPSPGRCCLAPRGH
jgi:hypothetical protein